ncbi:DNA polymerase III subunit delta [Immundisolibacter sp.]|uniref:DNA polymerase III subunit delta n=1 Tax=Immundisolibacter sp. TaxID=1934948 RepID=UPI00262F7D90|nr:DNA polymerase III subunit delta [Immundisolibacter sp.]MDD3650991.1 DNA polymerase III subunit delta [Immundisolibacter sp.]
MALKPEQLAAALARGLAPAYLLAGEEPLLVADAADAVRRAARGAGFGERVVYEVERGFDWRLLAGEAASLSLFAQRRLIELRLGSGKLADEGAAALVDFLAAPPPDVLLLLTAEVLDKRARSSAWYAACERAGVVVYAWPLEAAALPRWLMARARGLGLTLDESAAALLADLTEGNLLAAAQELDKLALLAPPGGALDRAGVLEAVGDSARYAARDLADAALDGDVRRLTRALAHLQDAGETPILALWQLTQDLQRLIDGNAFGQPPQRRELLERARRRRPAAFWQALLAQAALVDRANKGVGSGIDPWQALTALARRMAQPTSTTRS